MKLHRFAPVLLCLGTLSQASPLKVDCTFADPQIKDHILVQITSSDRGTFYYSAESDQATSATPTDTLVLKRVASTTNDIAKWQVDHDEVKLFYLMPAALIEKPSDDFKGTLLTEIPELSLSNSQELKCSSKL